MLARSGYGSGGALMEVSGEIAANATWSSAIYFSAAGVPTDLTGLSFRMTFRACDGESNPSLTLSTGDGSLSIGDDDDGNPCVLNILVQPPISLRGDYVCDLASTDADGVVTAWAHGVVTFRPNPVAF